MAVLALFLVKALPMNIHYCLAQTLCILLWAKLMKLLFKMQVRLPSLCTMWQYLGKTLYPYILALPWLPLILCAE